MVIIKSPPKHSKREIHCTLKHTAINMISNTNGGKWGLESNGNAEQIHRFYPSQPTTSQPQPPSFFQKDDALSFGSVIPQQSKHHSHQPMLPLDRAKYGP